MSKGSCVGDGLGELVVKFTCFGCMFTHYIYRNFSELNLKQNKTRSATLGYFRTSLPKHHTEIRTNSLFKVVCTLQVSPSLLNIRVWLCQHAGRSQRCLLGAVSVLSEMGSKLPCK